MIQRILLLLTNSAPLRQSLSPDVLQLSGQCPLVAPLAVCNQGLQAVSRMKILVTGGAGFIGSHTVERLLREKAGQITIIDSFNDYYNPSIKRENLRALGSRVSVFEGDIADPKFVAETFDVGHFDAVIHLAARAGVRPSIAQPELYIDTNIKGTFHLLEAARRTGVKHFVFASSSSVYGVNKKVPFAETDPILQTISPYAMTKMAGEQMCSNYSHLYGMKTVALRFFTVYGPRQRPDLAISKFSRLIEDGEPIDKYGDGSTARDYTFVHDIVEGIVGALNYRSGPICDIINIGGSQTVTLNELIATIEQAVGKQAIIHQMPEQPGDVPLTSADVSKAKALLGFEPTTTIAQGVPTYVEWFRDMRARGIAVC
jgi:UDP-glucuronate 4-epimerase